MNFNFLFYFILFTFFKLVVKNSYFLNKLLFLDGFWKHDSLIYKKKNFFINEIPFINFKYTSNFFFSFVLVDFYFYSKKKGILKFRRDILKKLKFYYLKKLFSTFSRQGFKNKVISATIKKIWYSFEFKFSNNWPLKLYIQQTLKDHLVYDNFLKAWSIMEHWKKYQQFSIFNSFKTVLLVKKFRKIDFLTFLNFYTKNYRKLIDNSNLRKKKLKQYHLKKLFFFKKFKYLSFRFFPRRYSNFENKFNFFPKKLQTLFAPYGITLKSNYLALFNSFKTISSVKLNEIHDQNLTTYYLKFKKKRSNFYFTIFNNRGEVVYYLSSGRFFKLNLKKRNRKLRNSFFSLSLMIRNICKVLKKKKIFKINVFIKPYFLKIYIIRRIFFSFFRGGIKLMSVRNLINFPHNRFTKNKKVRRI